jgi:hypothetical protein
MKHVLALTLLLPLLARAAETVDCPATLDVDATVRAPSGWQAFVPERPPALSRISLFSGAPEEGASLVPDKTVNQGQESKDTWLFRSGVPEGVWVVCHYNDTAVSLTRQLGGAVSRCEARYQRLRSGTRLKVIGMRCE